MDRRERTAVWLLGAVSLVSALACSSSQQIATADRETLAKEACFNLRNVDSFSPIGTKFVYLRTFDEEHYLLTLDAIYPNLPQAIDIKISYPFSRVCSDTGAMLTFMDFGRPTSCRIIRVEAVASKEVAEKVVKDRTTPKQEG